tara:strand:- start:984 stop:1358 length:375 start_codon:yes stop_codon:yes gene_type:complete
MKKIVKEAARVSANLWDADINRVLGNDCRKDYTIKAKRMLIYYLYNFVEISHNKMKMYIKNLDHATSIYHCRKFNEDLLESEMITMKFGHFMGEMKAFSIYGEEFEQKKKELEILKRELINLKK